MKKLCYTLLIFVFTISSFAQNNTFTDIRDGKVYKTVKIGTQTWMAENLAFKADSNSRAYNNNQNNVAKYGYLYNWETAKSVCPTGWHLPSKEEFENLINYCGGSNEAVYKALIPGGSSGFSVTFGGWCRSFDDFVNIGLGAHFWSSSPNLEELAWNFYVYSFSEASMDTHYRLCGYSVRCLKDN